MAATLAGAVPVATKVIGFPTKPDPAAEAVRVLNPRFGPRTHWPAVAIPLASVVWVPPVTVPPPEVTAKVTATPGSWLPLLSRTITEGGVATAVPSRALCVVGEFAAILESLRGTAVARKKTGLLVTPDPVTCASTVLAPVAGPRVQDCTVAAPFASVVVVRA